LLAACNSNTTTTPTTPTPVAVPTTESVTGELKTGTTDIHHFPVGIGVVNAILTGLSPVSTTLIGTAYGLWDGANCNPVTPTVVETNQMTVGTTLTGTAIKSTDLCLRVYDVGNIPADTTYTYSFTVTHY
jgi:hypothetical protein